MFARTILTALVSCCFLSIGIPKDCFADASAQLKQAQALKDNRKYDQAEAIYQQIVTDFPDTNDALEAKKQLVLIYTATYRQQEADTAFEQLITEFSEHKDIAEAVWQIANAHGQTEEYNKAFQLHRYNVEHFPEDNYAMRSQAEIVYYYIRDGNDADAGAAIDELLSVFCNQPDLPKEIYQIAERYKKKGRYDKVLDLNKYNVEHFPNHKYSMWSQVEIVYSRIRDGNDTAADEAVDKLLTVFSGQPELPKEIYQIAMKYNEAKRKGRALQLHSYNVERSSKNDMYAMWSQSEIIKSCISDGNNTAADAAVDKLLSVFCDQQDLPKEIYQLSERFNNAGRADKAGQLYQYIIKTWPDDRYAMLAKDSLSAGSYSDDDKAVDNDELTITEAIDKLLTDSNTDSSKDIPEVLSEIAAKYCKAGSHEKAIQLCQYVIDNWSDDASMVISGKLELAKVYIAEGNDIAVEAIVDELIADYGGNPSSPDAVFMIGEEYYNKANSVKGDPNLPKERAEENYRKALTVWESIITELPESEPAVTAHAYYFSAVCYRELGNHEKAIEHFEQLVNSWPNYQYAWSAQCLIGESYEKLQDSGALPESEAKPLIEQAYKAIIENYPTCSLVGHACLKLGWPSFKKSQWADAAYYFELFLQKSPDDPRRSLVLYDLGQTYEQQGELNLAAEVYRTFIDLAEPNDTRMETVKAKLEKLEGATK